MEYRGCFYFTIYQNRKQEFQPCECNEYTEQSADINRTIMVDMESIKLQVVYTKEKEKKKKKIV